MPAYGLDPRKLCSRNDRLQDSKRRKNRHAWGACLSSSLTIESGPGRRVVSHLSASPECCSSRVERSQISIIYLYYYRRAAAGRRKILNLNLRPTHSPVNIIEMNKLFLFLMMMPRSSWSDRGEQLSPPFFAAIWRSQKNAALWAFFFHGISGRGRHHRDCLLC